MGFKRHTTSITDDLQKRLNRLTSGKMTFGEQIKKIVTDLETHKLNEKKK